MGWMFTQVYCNNPHPLTVCQGPGAVSAPWTVQPSHTEGNNQRCLLSGGTKE